MTNCPCMDGPNDPDQSCLYCGGTGEYVSDERLEELRAAYAHLADPALPKVSHFHKERHASDCQHLAIIMALQIARVQAPGKRRLTMWADVSRDEYPPGDLVWHCNEMGSRDGYHDESIISLAATTFPDGTVLHIWEPDPLPTPPSIPGDGRDE